MWRQRKREGKRKRDQGGNKKIEGEIEKAREVGQVGGKRLVYFQADEAVNTYHSILNVSFFLIGSPAMGAPASLHLEKRPNYNI